MLRFKEFRHKINEAGAIGTLPTDPTDPAPAEPAEPPASDTIPKPESAQAPDNSAAVAKLKQEIDALVVQWVNELKKELVSGEMKTAPRGLWDRFKGGLANMWYGRYNQSNPYYWQNRLGDDLGRPVQSESTFNQLPFTLKEYMDLRNFFDQFEYKIKEDYEETGGTGGLRINQIINQKANELRQKLNNLLIQHAQSGALTPSAPQGSEPSGSSRPSRPKPERPTIDPKSITLPEGISDWKNPNPQHSTSNRDYNSLVTDMAGATEDQGALFLPRVIAFFGTSSGDFWDKFGGGLVSTSGACPDVPKILRYGDPRYKYFEKFDKPRLALLKKQKRIESTQGEIGTADDLKQKIASARLPRPRS